ncbi:MAG: iron dicitrate transport regulator FecR [Pseudopedobacter saltans]|uniref:Iron dicitrate transport regulator FecR n=1 Tax=Pseudopedobacter saltans TaxID=151895 RepID=A0A2W5EDI6_9SPHI|nr:MAG: iron dicitrate transport regulator FecR [Pseudopedobacter saltans]
MMSDIEWKSLLDKYLQNNCTAGEAEVVEEWFAHLQADKNVPFPQEIIEDSVAYTTEQWAIFEALSCKYKTTQENKVIPIRQKHFYGWVAAALIMVLLGYVSFLRLTWKPVKTSPVIAETKDVLPGGNHATLTLANGQLIVLDSSGIGTLASQNGMKVVKLDSGSLAYQGNTKQMSYNTLSTPKGGQYQLQLPDGTKVWLNAASSIRFPVAFIGAQREVHITGEAYFEVAHDAAKPFFVAIGNQKVKVLGTHFNINGYPEEPSIRTTLLQGSVLVSLNKESKRLKPGQQSLNQKSTLSIRQVDTDQVVAWKEGIFNLDNLSFQEFMNQLSRWYDLDIRYASGKIPNIQIRGEMGRNLKLSQVLEGLKGMNVKFEIRGNILIVKS